MAGTGVVLVLFVIFHLLGNLQIFLGADVINTYSAFLISKPALIWPSRLILLAAVILHIITGIELRNSNADSRPVKYKRMGTVQASISSLYMLPTGLIILVFIIVHLLHFTFHTLQPEFSTLVDAEGRRDVYSMVLHGFRDYLYTAIYVVALFALGMHLRHGLQSMLQTFGLYHNKYTPSVGKWMTVAGVLIAAAYISIPAAVVLGFLVLLPRVTHGT